MSDFADKKVKLVEYLKQIKSVTNNRQVILLNFVWLKDKQFNIKSIPIILLFFFVVKEKKKKFLLLKSWSSTFPFPLEIKFGQEIIQTFYTNK